jgi:predicted TIM-barrel fold metal-dependent hydrolase
MHIGSGTKTVRTGPDAPEAVGAVAIFTNSAVSLIDFLFSGVLVRYPNLKLLYAEAQIGWIPYVVERVDDVWETHRGWAHGQDHVPEPPSTYYYRQVHACFFKDSAGVDMLDRVGVDNALFETDYPHQDGTWPNSLAVAEKLLGHLPDDTVRKIIRGNAIRLFDLDLPA